MNARILLRPLAGFSVLLMIAGGCSSGLDTESADPADVVETTVPQLARVAEADVVETTAVPTTQMAPTTTVQQSEPAGEDDLVRFLAAVEVVLDGTDAAGTVLADPEYHVALGQFFCTELDAGKSVDQILMEELDGVESTDLLHEATLLGGVLGAAVATMCDQHADLI